jgi:hypothetical protein
MGWDAFGLPAENAAIERGIVPHAWTKQNIAQMKETLMKLGYRFNWEKEICTCDARCVSSTLVFCDIELLGITSGLSGSFCSYTTTSWLTRNPAM